MTENELRALVKETILQKCEDNYLEIKAAKDGCPKIFDTLSSFSNQAGGGRIIFGIDEDFEICGVYNADDLQRKIMEQSLQMVPVVRPLCTTARFDDKMVVCAEICETNAYDKPCFYGGVGRIRGSYIRVGDGDRRMNEYEVYSYEAFKRRIRDDLRTDFNGEEGDLESETFDKYVEEMKKKKPNVAELPRDKFMRTQNFEVSQKPTLAAILLFCDYPQAFFPQLSINAVVFPGTEKNISGDRGERFIDNARIDGNLPQMLEGALNFVRRNMKTRTIIDPVTGKRADRTEYPVVALRELILNALIHRDYSIYTENSPIVMEMYRDKFVIENPGGLYGRTTLDQLGEASADTRNPTIAVTMEFMEQSENRFSGIPTIRNAMKEYDLPEPLFENDRGVFRATLYNKIENSDTGELEEEKLLPYESELLEFCKIPRSRGEIEARFGGKISIIYLMKVTVHPLVKAGKLKMSLPERPKSKNQRYQS